MKNDIDRFFECVEKTNTCWLWTKSKNRLGYGNFQTGIRKLKTRKLWRSHRFAYNFLVQQIPKDMLVLHKCDNPPCVNPDHLFIGTQKDNVHDCIKKGRFPSNVIPKEKRRKKLTQTQVNKIRKEFIDTKTNYSKLGKKYGVYHSNIRAIILNQTWKD